MKMHQVQVPMVELNRCTEKRKNRKFKRSDNKWRNGYQKSCPIHYTNPFARDFLEIRQLYFISMNYGRWICAIRVA